VRERNARQQEQQIFFFLLSDKTHIDCKEQRADEMKSGQFKPIEQPIEGKGGRIK
jgi:hypothetical protein